MTKFTAITKEALRTLRPEIEAALTKLGKQYGVAFSVANGKYSNDATGAFKLEFVTTSKLQGGLSPKLILGAENWKTYAKTFGLDPKLLGKSFEYNGKTCTIKGISPTRRKYPVQVDMEGVTKLFPVDLINLYTDPKKLAAFKKQTAGWQKPGAKFRA